MRRDNRKWAIRDGYQFVGTKTGPVLNSDGSVEMTLELIDRLEGETVAVFPSYDMAEEARIANSFIDAEVIPWEC